MMRGDIEAATLTEPYISLAEKNGCRVICSAFYHGTEVASDKVDADTYARFNRAVKQAVKLINADKTKYLEYFIDYHKARDPEIGQLSLSDLRAGRIVVCDPAPSRRTNLSAPRSGSRAGACWRRPNRRLILSMRSSRRKRIARRPNRLLFHFTKDKRAGPGPCAFSFLHADTRRQARGEAGNCFLPKGRLPALILQHF